MGEPGVVQHDSTSKRRGRKALWLGLVLVLVAVAVVVLVVFQPQKLFIDDHVDEALPVAISPEPARASDGEARPASEPMTLARGSFISIDHGTTGTASVLDVGDTSYLRIEDLDTDNGPALFVYLTTNPAEGEEHAFDDDFVDLGGLKGNIGNQNYEIPTGTDLARYSTVVIWCDRFDAAFGAADLA
jgi:hypothetical protein